MRILVVEDEADLNLLLCKVLTKAGYTVDGCLDGEDAQAHLLGAAYDGILLDVMLPKKDGYTLVQELRDQGNDTPVLFLTARDSVIDKVAGLDSGADDYITKPFAIEELLARIRAALRNKSGRGGHMLAAGPLSMDVERHQVTVKGQAVELTTKEFDLLQLFVTNRGKVFSRESLLETIWKYDYLGDLRTVDVHIRRLREKIERVPSQPEYIFTKWGVGYYFTDKD